MIKSSPYSFVRFEHPDDNDISLDIPYTLPAFEKHESAFQFIVDGVDRPADQDIKLAYGDANGALYYDPHINAIVKSYRYKVPNLSTYTTFYFKQITIDGDVTIYNQTVTYEQFQLIMFDMGLDLSGNYFYSDVTRSILILADTTNVSGIPTDFDGVELTGYWHKGYAANNGTGFDDDPLNPTPDCFTYVLLLPDDSVMGYTNIFRRVNESDYTSLVTYSCNESAFDFIYDDSPNIVRLPIYLKNPQFPKKREVYRKSNGVQKVLSSLVEKEYEIETEQMPEVFHEAVAIMLGHDDVRVVCPNIREITVDVIEADTYNPQWEGEGILFAKGKGKVKVATFSHANSNCS
jgi:hypothetical protein